MKRFLGAMVRAGCPLAVLCAATSCYAPRAATPPAELPEMPDGMAVYEGWTPEIRSPVALRDALYHAWYEHPRMRSARAAFAAGRDRMLVARLWPNPRLRVDVADEDGYKTFYRTEVFQTLEIGGKRDARVALAAAEAVERYAGFGEAWAAVRADVKQSHGRYGYLVQRRALLVELREAAEQEHGLATELVTAGRKPSDFPAGFAVARAERAAALSVNADRTADAVRRFHAALGVSPVERAAGLVPERQTVGPRVLPDYATLYRAVTNASPRLATVRAAVLVARARLGAARAGRWSDPRVTGHFKHFEYDADGAGSDQFGVALEIDLPLRNLTRADTRAAAHDVASSRELARAAALSVAADLSRVLVDARDLETELDVLRTTTIPEAEQSWRLADSRSRLGKTDAFPGLRARRTLVAARLAALDTDWQLAVARIELERLGAILRTQRAPE